MQLVALFGVLWAKLFLEAVAYLFLLPSPNTQTRRTEALYYYYALVSSWL